MESISKILDGILAEGNAEAQQIIVAGRESAKEIFGRYEKEAGAIQRDILAKAEKKADEIQRRYSSQAGIESRNIKLSARRTALEQAFANAEQRMASMPERQKIDFYERLIARYSDGDDVVVQLNAADRNAFGRKIKVKGITVRFDDEAGDFSGGLIIRERDAETNCTFGMMVETAKKEMESEVASELFSSAKGEGDAAR